MSIATARTAQNSSQTRSAAAIAVPGVLAFTVPLVGFLASLLLPFLGFRVGPRLWPQTSPMIRLLCAALALTGLWLPAMLAVVSLGQLGLEATAWLILPLCAPTGTALVVPAVLASLTYLAGITVATLARSPWPWVIGAWLAPLTYSAAAHWLVDFTCLA